MQENDQEGPWGLIEREPMPTGSIPFTVCRSSSCFVWIRSQISPGTQDSLVIVAMPLEPSTGPQSCRSRISTTAELSPPLDDHLACLVDLLKR